jgi:hypothetical protein|tara:strand:- start:338 stop:499 length:162 start_codon:yes stop_codon:yes gene_type:complete
MVSDVTRESYNVVVRGVPPEVFEAFRVKANNEGRTMKYVLVQLMARWVLEAEQ